MLVSIGGMTNYLQLTCTSGFLWQCNHDSVLPVQGGHRGQPHYQERGVTLFKVTLSL
jgi:hypothetical protein